MQEAFGLVTPHGIQRIAQTEDHRASPAEQNKPEQRAKDGIVAVFQGRLDTGLGHAGLIKRAGVARDDPADMSPCCGQVAGR